MEREACVCDHGFERSDLCAEIIMVLILFSASTHGGPNYEEIKKIERAVKEAKPLHKQATSTMPSWLMHIVVKLTIYYQCTDIIVVPGTFNFVIFFLC